MFDERFAKGTTILIFKSFNIHLSAAHEDIYVCISPHEREIRQWCVYVKIYTVVRIKRIQESRFHKMISIHFLRRVIARELSFIFHVPNVMTRTCYLSKKIILSCVKKIGTHYIRYSYLLEYRIIILCLMYISPWNYIIRTVHGSNEIEKKLPHLRT